MLTFTIRLLILPLTFRSVKSMQKLQVLQPEMKKIQARFKDDRQRMNQEMMKFYQENKVNPLGSCLPLLLQIPFFIALFELLRSERVQGARSRATRASSSSRTSPSTLTGEPLVLALMIVLYVGTQLIASVITMVGGDKTQQRIMFALPFVFTIFIINFEAGLIVYWITTNVWTIGQQLVVRKLYPKPAGARRRRAGRKRRRRRTSGGKPARGKAAPAGAAAVSDGGNGGGATKAPPARRARRRSAPGAAGSGDAMTDDPDSGHTADDTSVEAEGATAWVRPSGPR